MLKRDVVLPKKNKTSLSGRILFEKDTLKR